MEDLILELEMKMEAAFDAMLVRYSKTRTGRANAAALDNIRIDYYGATTPIKQLCNISIPEPRLIVVQPWDKTTLADIEKALLASNIGVTPDNDGNVIRLPFQPLTEETRRDIVKQIKRMTEEGKICFFCGGIGNPFFTTDTAAVLRAIELKADVVLKGTKVNGVYTADPVTNKDAKFIENTTYDEVLDKKLKVMDMTAFSLARDYNMPIKVFNVDKRGNLKDAIVCKDVGTFVHA